MYLRISARKKIGIETPIRTCHQASVVERGAVLLRRQEAERDPDDHSEEAGRQRQFKGGGKALLDLVGDWAAGGDAGAELAVPDGLQVAPVLDVDRLVEPVLLADPVDVLLRRALAEERVGRAPGQRPDPDEDQQ